MFILLIAKIALTPQTWKSTNQNKKAKNNKKTQPHRDGEAVFYFTHSPQTGGWYSYVSLIFTTKSNSFICSLILYFMIFILVCL